MVCPRCGNMVSSTNVCPKCGYNLNEEYHDMIDNSRNVKTNNSKNKPIKNINTDTIVKDKRKKHSNYGGEFLLFNLLAGIFLILAAGTLFFTSFHYLSDNKIDNSALFGMSSLVVGIIVYIFSLYLINQSHIENTNSMNLIFFLIIIGILLSVAGLVYIIFFEPNKMATNISVIGVIVGLLTFISGIYSQHIMKSYI